MRIIRPAALIVVVAALLLLIQPDRHPASARPIAASVHLVPTTASTHTSARRWQREEIGAYVHLAQERSAALTAFYTVLRWRLIAAWVDGFRWRPVIHSVVHIPHKAASSAPTHYVAGTSSGGGGGGSVAACVRHVESRGDYHVVNSIGAAGAYQYMPPTWRHYAQLVPGASSYSSAAQAPPAVQDAVFAATLAAGGGSNWSGSDPCTGH